MTTQLVPYRAGPPGPAPQRDPWPARRRVAWRRATRIRRLGFAALVAVPVGLVVIFFAYPVGSIIALGLAGPEGPAAFARVLTRARFVTVASFTIWQAAASAGASLLIGLPVAQLLYRRRFPGRAAVRALVTVPFVLPTVVVGLAFATLFAPSGWLGSWGWSGSAAAIVTAHVFFNMAVVVRTVGASWAHLDPRPLAAARSLGAGPLRAFATVTVPALAPALAGAAVMVFLFSATSFGVIIVMGAGRYSTLETEIYRQTAQVGDLPAAAVLSIVQILLVTATLVVAARARRGATLTLRSAAQNERELAASDAPAIAVTAVALALVIAPLATLVTRSLTTPAGWSLDNYRNLATVGENNVLLVSGTEALVNSVRSALLATVFATTVGIIVAVVLSRRTRTPLAGRAAAALDGAMMLPLGVSAVTVGFGFLVALDKPPLDLRSSALLVPIAQAMIATPIVVRMVLPVLRAADDRLRSAAALAGAGPFRVFADVDLRLISRALAGALAFAAATGFGEFGATMFVARPETVTLPVVIGRLITRPGATNTGMALAAGVILAAVCAAVVLAADLAASRRGGSGIGGF